MVEGSSVARACGRVTERSNVLISSYRTVLCQSIVLVCTLLLWCAIGSPRRGDITNL